MVYFSDNHRSDRPNHHHLKTLLKNQIPSCKPQSQSQDLKDVSQANSDEGPGSWIKFNSIINIIVNGLNKNLLFLTCWSRCHTIPLFRRQFQKLNSLPWLGASTATKHEESSIVKGTLRLFFEHSNGKLSCSWCLLILKVTHSHYLKETKY